MHTLSTLSITGPDAFEFLQGQLTNDLRRLETEDEILAAWCNPKGRVIWFGTVRATDSGYGLSAPAETAADIVKRLTVFRFRSKVDFEAAEAVASIDPTELIEKGLAFIGTAQLEQFTPHMLNLDLLDAISLDKGCYTGQEIVARTHYKGATKRRALRFESAEPVAVGDKVACEGRDVGEVLNVAGTALLAVVPVDKAGASLKVKDVPLQLRPLPYFQADGREIAGET